MRILNFIDGFESETQPDVETISATMVQVSPTENLIESTNLQDALEEIQGGRLDAEQALTNAIDEKADQEALNAHEEATGAHGVGEVVGRTEGQTLVNKRFVNSEVEDLALDALDDTPESPGAGKVKIFFDGVANKLTILNAAGTKLPVGSSGAGSIAWNAPEGYGAELREEFGVKVYSFQKDETNTIVSLVQVPSGYSPGSQPKLRLVSYSNDVNFHAYQVTSTLIKPTMALDDTTHRHWAESGDTSFGGTPAKVVKSIDVPLSDAAGLIDDEALQAGDFLMIEIMRVPPGASVDSTADSKIVFGSMGVSF